MAVSLISGDSGHFWRPYLSLISSGGPVCHLLRHSCQCRFVLVLIYKKKDLVIDCAIIAIMQILVQQLVPSITEEEDRTLSLVCFRADFSLRTSFSFVVDHLGLGDSE